MNILPILSKYGRKAGLFDRQDVLIGELYAFIQPLRYKNKMYLDGVNTQIGFNNQGHYLYIGPPDHDLTEIDSGVYLACNGTKYKIDRAEVVYKGSEKYYVWAIIREIVEES